MAPTQNHFTVALNRALKNPSNKTFALINLRVALANVLAQWPSKLSYKAVDIILPWGKPISIKARRVLAGLGESVEAFVSVSIPPYNSADLKHVFRYAHMFAI